MKKILCTSVAIPLLHAATAYADFILDDLNGQYDHSFSATAVSNEGDGALTEVGILSADGQGHLTGKGNTTRSDYQGDSINSNVTYDCSYTVNPNGTGTMDCVLNRDGNFSNASFSFVIDKEINSLGGDPAALEGVHQKIRFHSLSELPFIIKDASVGPVQASYHAFGSAHRQSEYVEPPPQPQPSRYTNVDEDGKYLIDVLFVITSEAKAAMEISNVNPDEWALKHINKTNADLARSQITTSKLRYVGKHYVDESDYERTGRYPSEYNGTHSLFWLSKYRETYGADKIAVIHMNVGNYASGDTASFPFRTNIPFSHEIGHTMQIFHGGCDGGDYTTKGYNNGAQFRWLNLIDGEEVLPFPPGSGTIMCGNDSGFFSNPNITLSWEQIQQNVAEGTLPHDLSYYEPLRETGLKLGDPVFADAARKWMEIDEAASKISLTSLPHGYTEDEWNEDDNCVAFYSEKNYTGAPTGSICIGEGSANDPNILEAQSIKVGRNTAIRYFTTDDYIGELATLIYSSYNLQDYADTHGVDFTRALSAVVFSKDDKDTFLSDTYVQVQTLGEGNDWQLPGGITATEDGKTVYALHANAIDVFDTNTGTRVNRIDIAGQGSYQWGLGITQDGKLFMPSENSNVPCQLINPEDGSLTAIANCKGNDADVDSEGNLYVVNRNGNLYKFTALEDGTYSNQGVTISKGSLGGGWLSLAIDKARNIVYIVSLESCQVLVYDLTTRNYLRSVGDNPADGCSSESTSRGQLRSPYGVAVDKNGWVYVTESRQPWYLPERAYFNVGVQVYDENGNFADKFGTTMRDPSYVVAPNNGTIYALDSAFVRTTPGPSRVIAYRPQSQLP